MEVITFNTNVPAGRFKILNAINGGRGINAMQTTNTEVI